MAEWLTPQSVTGLLAALGLSTGAGGIFYFRLRRADVALRIEQAATGVVAMQQSQLDRQAAELTAVRSELGDLADAYEALREWIIKDAAWHQAVTADLRRLGQSVPASPPPPRRFKRTH